MYLPFPALVAGQNCHFSLFCCLHKEELVSVVRAGGARLCVGMVLVGADVSGHRFSPLMLVRKKSGAGPLNLCL